jgi:hypothetical protein
MFKLSPSNAKISREHFALPKNDPQAALIPFADLA